MMHICGQSQSRWPFLWSQQIELRITCLASRGVENALVSMMSAHNSIDANFHHISETVSMRAWLFHFCHGSSGGLWSLPWVSFVNYCTENVSPPMETFKSEHIALIQRWIYQYTDNNLSLNGYFDWVQFIQNILFIEHRCGLWKGCRCCCMNCAESKFDLC